jgi:glycosyltransferase involved in cell wall biosynthesis
MNSPEVSVVIPAYNYAHYLPVAIHSVLSQDHRALECIVVDDGSTDATHEVVAAIPDPRLRYVHQQNAGLSAARNTGIREARHDFIALLDADDRWAPSFLARVVPQFSELPPKFGAIASASRRIDEKGEVIAGATFTFGSTSELGFRDFCLRNRPLSSSIVLRKAALAQCGEFDPSLRSSEDRDYWLRLTAQGWRFHFLDEPLADIRRHTANMSKAAPRMRANSLRALQRARLAGVVPRWSPFWLRVFSLHHLQAARAHHGDGYRLRALGHLAASLALWPLFTNPSALSERHFFRLRQLARFILDAARGK